RVDPVFTKHLAGPWLKFSVETPERNARSSTTPPMLGSSSETYCPHFPYRLNSRRVPSSLGGSLENVSMNAKRLPLSSDSGVAFHLRWGRGFPLVLREACFEVEQPGLARAARHEQVDDVLHFRREMRRLRRGRIHGFSGLGGAQLSGDQGRQGNLADADTAAA